MLRAGLSVIIMGAPGGGKGTISKKILKDFKFNHISTGDILRKHVQDKTELGLIANSYMVKGALVPDTVVIDMLRLIHKNKKNDESLLLDGFPRTIEQAKQLSTIFPIDCLISLDIPHQTIIDRLSNRWIHAPSGRIYSYDYNPPKIHNKDDITGEPLSQRDDDKPETISKRLISYEQMTKPLIEYYRNHSKNTHVEVFQGTESDVIYPNVKNYLLKHFKTK
jgi:nucleoside-triphosphate--adenylate kinase